MTYFYPFGYTNPTATNSTFAQTATTASFTASFSTPVGVTRYATTVFATGASGSTGPTHTSASCAVLNPGRTITQGPSGSIGPSGSRGSSLTTCPAGSVVCPSLTPPSGYAIVCIQTGSCGGISVCPDVLP